jgi:hypothetical protein
MHCTKIKSAGPPPYNRFYQHSSSHKSRSTLLLGHCSKAVQVWTRHINEHHLTQKSFDAVSEAFSNVYPDKKVLNKTTIHWLVTTFSDTGSVCLWQVLTEWQTAEITAVPISSSTSTATMGYGYKNSICMCGSQDCVRNIHQELQEIFHCNCLQMEKPTLWVQFPSCMALFCSCSNTILSRIIILHHRNSPAMEAYGSNIHSSTSMTLNQL